VSYYSGRRRPRCGICFDKGHNRTTCPTMTERIRKLDEGEVEYDYAATCEKERKIRRKNATIKRKCSYCRCILDYDDQHKAIGHNRRSCATLKVDLAEDIKRNTAWRKDFVRVLKREGLGPGAIIKWIGEDLDDPKSRYHRPSKLYFLDKIKWEHCLYSRIGNPRNAIFEGRAMTEFNQRCTVGTPDLLGMDGKTELTREQWREFGESKWSIASPSTLEFEVPEEFYDDPAPVKAIFDLKK